EGLGRPGRRQEAAAVCRAGLVVHPGYISARLTLARTLIALGSTDEAQAELERIIKTAPDNLAAIRELAEIHHQRGSLTHALAQYRRALALTRHDPELEKCVAELEGL